jgi:hypothetical protein
MEPQPIAAMSKRRLSPLRIFARSAIKHRWPFADSALSAAPSSSAYQQVTGNSAPLKYFFYPFRKSSFSLMSILVFLRLLG